MWLDCPARASRRGRSAVGEIETRSADDARQTPPRAALHLHTPFASYPLLTLLRIQPIAPTRRKNPFNDPDWLFDVKYDGFRGLCYVEHGRCRFDAFEIVHADEIEQLAPPTLYGDRLGDRRRARRQDRVQPPPALAKRQGPEVGAVDP